jgi:hypothetical protein
VIVTFIKKQKSRIIDKMEMSEEHILLLVGWRASSFHFFKNSSKEKMMLDK